MSLSLTEEELKRMIQDRVREETRSSTVSSSKPSDIYAPESSEKHAHCDHCGQSTGQHFVRANEKFCPTCGEKNPGWTSTVVCADCGIPLGTREEAEKRESCPNCGGRKGKEIK